MSKQRTNSSLLAKALWSPCFPSDGADSGGTRTEAQRGEAAWLRSPGQLAAPPPSRAMKIQSCSAQGQAWPAPTGRETSEAQRGIAAYLKTHSPPGFQVHGARFILFFLPHWCPLCSNPWINALLPAQGRTWPNLLSSFWLLSPTRWGREAGRRGWEEGAPDFGALSSWQGRVWYGLRDPGGHRSGPLPPVGGRNFCLSASSSCLS